MFECFGNKMDMVPSLNTPGGVVQFAQYLDWAHAVVRPHMGMSGASSPLSPQRGGGGNYVVAHPFSLGREAFVVGESFALCAGDGSAHAVRFENERAAVGDVFGSADGGRRWALGVCDALADGVALLHLATTLAEASPVSSSSSFANARSSGDHRTWHGSAIEASLAQQCTAVARERWGIRAPTIKTELSMLGNRHEAPNASNGCEVRRGSGAFGSIRGASAVTRGIGSGANVACNDRRAHFAGSALTGRPSQVPRAPSSSSNSHRPKTHAVSASAPMGGGEATRAATVRALTALEAEVRRVAALLYGPPATTASNSKDGKSNTCAESSSFPSAALEGLAPRVFSGSFDAVSFVLHTLFLFYVASGRLTPTRRAAMMEWYRDLALGGYNLPTMAMALEARGAGGGKAVESEMALPSAAEASRIASAYADGTLWLLAMDNLLRLRGLFARFDVVATHSGHARHHAGGTWNGVTTECDEMPLADSLLGGVRSAEGDSLIGGDHAGDGGLGLGGAADEAAMASGVGLSGVFLCPREPAERRHNFELWGRTMRSLGIHNYFNFSEGGGARTNGGARPSVSAAARSDAASATLLASATLPSPLFTLLQSFLIYNYVRHAGLMLGGGPADGKNSGNNSRWRRVTNEVIARRMMRGGGQAAAPLSACEAEGGAGAEWFGAPRDTDAAYFAKGIYPQPLSATCALRVPSDTAKAVSSVPPSDGLAFVSLPTIENVSRRKEVVGDGPLGGLLSPPRSECEAITVSSHTVRAPDGTAFAHVQAAPSRSGSAVVVHTPFPQISSVVSNSAARDEVAEVKRSCMMDSPSCVHEDLKPSRESSAASHAVTSRVGSVAGSDGFVKEGAAALGGRGGTDAHGRGHALARTHSMENGTLDRSGDHPEVFTITLDASVSSEGSAGSIAAVGGAEGATAQGSPLTAKGPSHAAISTSPPMRESLYAASRSLRGEGRNSAMRELSNKTPHEVLAGRSVRPSGANSRSNLSTRASLSSANAATCMNVRSGTNAARHAPTTNSCAYTCTASPVARRAAGMSVIEIGYGSDSEGEGDAVWIERPGRRPYPSAGQYERVPSNSDPPSLSSRPQEAARRGGGMNDVLAPCGVNSQHYSPAPTSLGLAADGTRVAVDRAVVQHNLAYQQDADILVRVKTRDRQLSTCTSAITHWPFDEAECRMVVRGEGSGNCLLLCLCEGVRIAGAGREPLARAEGHGRTLVWRCLAPKEISAAAAVVASFSFGRPIAASTREEPRGEMYDCSLPLTHIQRTVVSGGVKAFVTLTVAAAPEGDSDFSAALLTHRSAQSMQVPALPHSLRLPSPYHEQLQEQGRATMAFAFGGEGALAAAHAMATALNTPPAPLLSEAS